MAFSFHFNSISLVLILVALVFLILACISTPTVSAFKLASTNKYDFGIFGHCKSGGSSCSSATYPYKLSEYQSLASYKFIGSTRDTLAKIFILIPIAGFFNLVSLIIVGLSHCLSTTLLIVALVTTIIAFILATILCIVVILAFYPVVAWTGWILVGAAAADLIAIPFLIVALKLKRNDSHDDGDSSSSLSDVIRNGTVDDLTKFDDKFGHVANPGFAGPGAGVGAATANANSNNFTHHTDETSSISKEYEYKVNTQPYGYNSQTGNGSQQLNVAPPPNQFYQAPATKTYSNNSVYNSNPQLANDFTNHQKPSAISVAQYTNSSSYYEDAQVNLVNGPNTPISAKQQMAPNLVPRVATPTSNDAPPPLSNPPALPYPQSNPTSPLNRPAYNPTNYSVFEHHPEVEGHKPFTELNDDDDVVDDEFNNHNNHYGAGNAAVHNGRSVDGDSDNDSDFTSVSQRAVNPKYNNNINPNYNNPGYFPAQPQQQYPNTAQYSPQFQPVQQQQRSPVVGQFGPMTQQPQQFYSGPPPQQQAYAQQQAYGARPPPQQQYSGVAHSGGASAVPPQSRGPTISDNVLNNNPDFALGLGGGAKRKPYGGPVRPMGGAGGFPSASRLGGGMPGGAPGGMPGAPVGPGGKKANGLRDGPYGMLR